MSNQDDLSKENEQQTKTIRHLQTRIKLLEKSQNDLYKTTNQIERENKSLKAQVSLLHLSSIPPHPSLHLVQIEERNNEIKVLKNERRKEKADFENKMKLKLNDIEQQFVSDRSSACLKRERSLSRS